MTSSPLNFGSAISVERSVGKKRGPDLAARIILSRADDVSLLDLEGELYQIRATHRPGLTTDRHDLTRWGKIDAIGGLAVRDAVFPFLEFHEGGEHQP